MAQPCGQLDCLHAARCGSQLPWTLAPMFFALSPRRKWWLYFTASVTLPVWAIGGLLNFGGWITDAIPFPLYQWFNILCFLSALALTTICLSRPSGLKAIRVLAGVVLGAVLLGGAALCTVSSSCGPTTMKLGRAFGGEARSFAAVGGCDAVALTMQSTRTR